jgi:hypothetical protein
MSQDSTEKIMADIQTVIDDFILELDSRISTQELESVLSGKKDDLNSFELNQKPETFTEDYLIHPILDAVGLQYERQPYAQKSTGTGWADFKTLNTGEDVIGECKPLNEIERGVDDIRDYLGDITNTEEHGILTDGINWRIFTIEYGGDTATIPKVGEINLRRVIQARARELGAIASTELEDVDADSRLATFIDLFEPDALETLLTSKAPQRIRNMRQKNVDEFFELYIELLFGASDEYDYDTFLMKDIESPPGAAESQTRQFAIALMNRLIFIKNLENKGVVPDGLLLDRLQAHKENEGMLMNSFYESQLKPLFYDLFNQPQDDRPLRLRKGWTDEIPYLNGGLFRENVDDEKEYDIKDRVLPRIIRDLIEGGELDVEGNSLDPAVLGSVFEKTINLIGGELGTQKDIGAYYTPDDVTRVITRQTVDPKLKQTLVTVWVNHTDVKSDHAKSIIEEYLNNSLTLSEFLDRVSRGQITTLQHDDEFIEIDFGDELIIKEAISELNDLSVLDPACGSGHFLTSVMEQIYRVRVALTKGKKSVEKLPKAEKFQVRKDIALNVIYGVDVDPVGVQIARLRVWLKIIEEGWDERFGRLPNIELNIISGNSLVGLPVYEDGATQLGQYTDELDELVELRREYKQEDSIEKSEVLEQRDEIRAKFDSEFINRLNYMTETEIESIDEWNSVAESIDKGPLYSDIESIKITRSDGNALTDEEISRLDDLGFRTYSKSARVQVRSRHDDLRSESSRSSHADVRELMTEQLGELLQDGFVFSEVVRQPVEADLNGIKGSAVHWIGEFPELTPEDSSKTIDIDIIVGNPPYGRILTDAENVLIDWMETGNMNEIAGPFVERQLQLLAVSGRFGNIHAQGLLYKKRAAPARDAIADQLQNGRTASFGHRPSTVFAGANPRAAITSGQKVDNEIKSKLRTSELILFYPEEREQAFSNIEYSPIDGLVLGDHIGDSDTNAAYPKVGCRMSRTVLQTLKDNSERKIGDASTRNSEKTDHYVYRSYHPLYWMNPFLEDLYTQHPSDDVSPSRDFEAMYFMSEVERRAAFLLMQSSTFYHYWTVYENQRDLNWGPIDAFPFPEKGALQEVRDNIFDLSDEMWDMMQRRFNGRGIENGADLKPVADEIDELFGPLLGMNKEMIEWIKSYHAGYGRENKNKILEGSRSS